MGLLRRKKLLSEYIDKDLTIQKQLYRKYRLPITMDPFKYGKLIIIEKFEQGNSYYMKVTPYAKIIPKDTLKKRSHYI